jgi:hypothetical protein
MPPSEAEPAGPEAETPGLTLAVVAEALYLANLLLLPGLAFVALAVLFLRADPRTPPLASAHLEQTFTASLWAGILLVFVNLVIVALGGWRGPYTWVVVIVYFTVCHSTLILLGMVGLAKALAGQCYRFPLVGRDLPFGCGGRP